MDFIEWAFALAGYFTAGGAAFRVAANHTECPEDPWETPGPLAVGIFWPVAMPFLMGTRLPRNPARKGRSEKRREQEIKEAEHQRALAKINAEALAIAEKGAKLS